MKAALLALTGWLLLPGQLLAVDPAHALQQTIVFEESGGKL
jgi:hypothetical protein